MASQQRRSVILSLSFRKFPMPSGISTQILTSHHEPLTSRSLHRTELVNRTSLASFWMNFTNVFIFSSVNWLSVTCVHLLKHMELKYVSKSLHTTKKKRKTKQKISILNSCRPYAHTQMCVYLLVTTMWHRIFIFNWYYCMPLDSIQYTKGFILVKGHKQPTKKNPQKTSSYFKSNYHK